MNALTVQALHRYPVKSMGGETLETAQLESRGIPGDRGWAVRDEERGGIRGGKRFAGLMNLSARYLEEPTTTERSPRALIEFPGGEPIESIDADANARLTEYLGNPVTLWPLLPETALDHYRRGAPESADLEAELRRVFARTDDEPLPDLSQFPAELTAYESPPGTYFDAFPLLVMTQQSLDSMQQLSDAHERGGGAQFDVRRFRPNILLGGAFSEPFPEEGWGGRELELGSARLALEMPCPRCIMTTHGFADLPKAPEIMRTLVRENGGNLGIYARVSEPGTIRLGDTATLI